MFRNQIRRLITETGLKGVRKLSVEQKKVVLTMTSNAIKRLRQLKNENDSLFLKIGVKRRGCSGQSYSLEYVTKSDKFDEVVEQEDVKVLIDSKALLTLLGSQMDYVEDKLSSQFVFNNPNVKEMCGCGQSFMT